MTRGLMRVIQLDKVQRGDQPDDFKPMPTIGKKRFGQLLGGRI